MDNELKQLEDELRSYRPRAVSPALLSRIDQDLRPRRRRWPLWLPIPALLAVVLGFFLSGHGSSATAGAVPSFRAVSAQSTVMQSSDDGYVTLSDGSIVKRTRQTSVDTVVWKDPASHASLTWSVPREDVTVIPVSYQ